MDDADIYAYEQEYDEMDEWETMHAHDLEAMEEEMKAMDAAEHAAKSHQGQALQTSVTIPIEDAPNDNAKQIANNSDGDNQMTDIQDLTLNAQDRLDQVLERCATLLGEHDEDMEDTELMDDYIVRKQKGAAVDSSIAEFLHSRPPIDVDSLPVVLDGGQRMFLRKKQLSTFADDGLASERDAADNALKLISVREMMETIERRQIEDAMAKDVTDEDVAVLSRPTQTAEKSVLWIDKYKPQRFIDLLSDERTNREVLSWIKQWDRFVFPHKTTATNIGSNNRGPASPGFKKSFGAPDTKKKYGVKNAEFNSSASNEPEDKRPREKIILLCGPPGAGKTTLANIIARHAGYNPIEVNASDDRTAGVLKNKIISAMEMQSIWGSRKPNCIILDEIDGAMNSGDGRTAIAAIQEIVSAPLNTKKNTKGNKNARSANNHPLTRPLICICNDQFASVLRPLRQLAKIFVLDTPNSQRLISRLKFICRNEGVKTTTGALAGLCTSADNDIRYCLNTLQFQSTQATKSLSSALVGEKDHTRGMFDTMEMIFYHPKSSSTSASAKPPVFDRIEEAANSMGNFSMLVNGLDENLPKMIFNDPTMNKLCAAFEWMGIADAWDNKVHSDQQFAFASYIPFAAMAVHQACCTSSRRRIEYPKSHFESQKKRDKSINILQALAENTQLHQSLRVSAGTLVVDVVPWLLATISPNIRRLNPSLQSAEEKAMIQRLIQVMAALGLSFRPKFLPDGSEEYTLEPAIHELVMFRDSEGTYRSVLPMNVRKMITHEVELEQMRRSEKTSSSNDSTIEKNKLMKQNTAPGAAPKATAFVLPEISEEEKAEKLHALQKRNPFAFAHREAKRKREQEQINEQQEKDGVASDSSLPTRPSVRYKFNEGYTCGIKTTVYIRDLL